MAYIEMKSVREMLRRFQWLREVELLQGALDAEAVLRALPRERREGLEINLALALLKMGREEAVIGHNQLPVRKRYI